MRNYDRAMKTERLRADRSEDVARAAEILRGGGLVAFPTETVYGLGANALSAESVADIFAAKDRPAWDPLIVHVESIKAVRRVALLAGRSRELAERFWPGPLTLLLPRAAAVPDAVTAGRSLVGVRVPAHPVARRIIQLAGVPLAAPSANRFGHTSPTTAQHVLDDLDGRIDAVLDGGPAEVGVESTVAHAADDGAIMVYRAGGVDLNSYDPVLWRDAEHSGAPESLPSPGVGMRHYAPRARLELVGFGSAALSRRRTPLESSLVAVVDEAVSAGRVGVMLPDGWDRGVAEEVFRWGPWRDAQVLARRVFAGLRALDDAGVAVIVCPVPEMDGLGEALRDRLGKAARVR